MPSLPAIVGQNVRERRVALQISQEQLASRSGLHRTYIGAVERGERNITLESLERIALALGVAPADLLVALSVLNAPATSDS